MKVILKGLLLCLKGELDHVCRMLKKLGTIMSQNRSTKTEISIAIKEYLQLFFVVVAAYFAYQLVDKPKEVRESAKMTSDVSKAIQELRPQVNMGCTHNIQEEKMRVVVFCKLQNFGAHAVSISKPKFELSKEGVLTPDSDVNSDGHFFVHGGRGNHIVPKGHGNVAYYLQFKSIDTLRVVADDFYAVTSISAETEEVIVEVFQELLKEFLSKETIDKLSTQNYHYSAPINDNGGGE